MNTYQNQSGKNSSNPQLQRQMTTPLPKNKERILLNKLRGPLHISFIAESILECNEYNAKEILKDYIEEGVIEEVKDNKNFYKLKSNA
jgi:hypothetical protein